MRVFALACMVLGGFVFCEEVKNYRGFHSISVQAENEQQLAVLHKLQRENHDLIFLREPSLVLSTDVVVSPEEKEEVMGVMEEAGMSVSLLSTDLQAEIEAEQRQNQANKLMHRGPFLRNGRFSPPHDAYYTVDEVNDIMANFAASYPGLVVMKQMNRTSEQYKRTIYYLEIGTATDANGNKDKPVMFVEGLAHSREWIVTASLIYSIDMMLSGFVAQDAEMVDALTAYTWVIIPVVNPDGYEYSWNTNRMWRKNRKVINGQCSGVDLNRNFDVDFGNTGVSFNCRDDTYPGQAPFSEAETQNIADLFNQLKPRVVSYLAVHAYSQLLFYPWAYIPSNSPSLVPDNLDQLISMGQRMKQALESLGKQYLLGTAFSTLGYAASGSSKDWALQEKPGIYAYGYELRPRNYDEGHFILPPSQIIPSGKELLASLMALASGIAEERQRV